MLLTSNSVGLKPKRVLSVYARKPIHTWMAAVPILKQKELRIGWFTYYLLFTFIDRLRKEEREGEKGQEGERGRDGKRERANERE